MLLVLELVPGSSVGPFTLGMPLSRAMKYVRDRKSEYHCVEVKYADQALFDHDLILNFPEHGMHLRFEPSSQQLRLIEVYDVSRMQLRYGRGVLGGASHAATALLVYELMGPTYPGKYDADSRMYHLQYPGLLFLFPIPPQHAQHCLSLASELHLEFPDHTTPVASRICIHSGTTAVSLQMAGIPGDTRLAPAVQPVTAVLGQGLSLHVGSRTVSFGDSPQDVCSALGMPSSAVQKPVDPMRRSLQRSPAPDYFYIYASRGIDVLFDGITHRVKKVVLRTNAPGHSEFNAYSKCNFVLHVHPVNSPPASRSSSVSQLSQSPGERLPDLAEEPKTSHEPGEIAARIELDASGQPDQATEAEPETLTPNSPLQDAVQGMLRDVFSSPRSNPPDKTPPKGKQDSGEGSAWERATEWSKNILDLSSGPFTFGDGTASAQSTPLASRGRVEEATEGAEPSLQGFASLPKDFRAPSKHQVDLMEGEAADAAQEDDQRDGWDDADSVLLGLDLPQSEADGPAADRGSAGPEAACAESVRGSLQDSSPQELLKQTATVLKAREQGEPDPSQTENHLLMPPDPGQQMNSLQEGQAEGGMNPETGSAVRPRIEITSDSHLKDIQAVMGDAGIATIHTRGLGSNPFARTHVHGYKGVAFEIMRNGYLASMTLFQVPC